MSRSDPDLAALKERLAKIGVPGSSDRISLPETSRSAPKSPKVCQNGVKFALTKKPTVILLAVSQPVLCYRLCNR